MPKNVVGQPNLKRRRRRLQMLQAVQVGQTYRLVLERGKKRKRRTRSVSSCETSTCTN
ncbi:hypothetical protein FVEG_08112 [Fusarium verticillioides 7600]|uniref:Uncharacterized protein n=1 Tax=Gibberella moniliformis (strain M3125 / FGSC 7600) TaxID=334819 RepID=W7MKH6_GIBM7|nr:hypothetical protein FVEG_08112 [Fusarium verticillioides 7600]EWG48284.1 hypothetical protein FVEG_08112 [Fusarium verticillioides 7600]